MKLAWFDETGFEWAWEMKWECWDELPYFPQTSAFQLLSVLVKSFFKKVLKLDFNFAAVTDVDGILCFLFWVFFLGHILRGA